MIHLSGTLSEPVYVVKKLGVETGGSVVSRMVFAQVSYLIAP
jgi:hypothetical protein